MKSESKSSLGAQSSSSPIVSESEDEISPIISEESQVSVSQPHDHLAIQPTLAASVTEKVKGDKTLAVKVLQSKKTPKIATLKPKKVTSTPLKKSVPPLTSKLSAIAKEPSSDGLSHKEQGNGKDLNTGAASQTLDSSSDLVDVTDSEMSIMSGLNLNTVEDLPRQSTGIENENKLTKEENNTGTTEHAAVEIESDKHGDPGDPGEGGGGSEGDESGSVTVTELSREEEEEEIEEDIDNSEEDTMFEETLQQSGAGLIAYIDDYLEFMHADCLSMYNQCAYIELQTDKRA